MKIGIFGGTFDPVHNGHMVIAKQSKALLGLDQMIFVPAGRPPHKEGGGFVCKTHRLNMLHLVADEWGFLISSYELDKDSTSYTYQTLEFFAEKYPDAELIFLVGADSLDYMALWAEPERIFHLCTVAVAPRSGYDDGAMLQKAHVLAEKFSANILFLDILPVDISSTTIRRKVAQGQDISPYVPQAVMAYISKHHLYQNT